MATRKILCLGASYGSLLGIKLAMAGHHVTLVCLPEEVELINTHGALVRMPVRGREGLVDIHSRDLPGQIDAAGPGDVDPGAYDLIALAMQEPQYGADGVRQLLDAIGRSQKPTMSIMNMPPLPYLKRIAAIDAASVEACFTAPEVWSSFTPGKLTLCSPDPQAFRPPDQPLNVLQVRLPTNFKAAAFEDDADTAILRDLQADIEAATVPVDGTPTTLPVKLKAHDSIFVPLAKWAMLLAGNYRCVQADQMRPIQEAVHTDLEASHGVYAHVVALCERLGADPADMVPFEKYAQAAQALGSPSSAARALAAGARNIERVDKLVQTLGQQQGMPHAEVDATVALVDGWLAKNRAA
ncbi:MAG: hypothetical protein AAFR04_12870 [Pseudomonadota bacterium]